MATATVERQTERKNFRLYLKPDMLLEGIALHNGLPNTNLDKVDPTFAEYIGTARPPYTPGSKDWTQVVKPADQNNNTFVQHLANNGLVDFTVTHKFYFWLWVEKISTYRELKDKEAEQFQAYQNATPGIFLIELATGMSLANVTPLAMDLSLLTKATGDDHDGRFVDLYTVGSFDSPFIPRTVGKDNYASSVPYFRIKGQKASADKVAQIKASIPAPPREFLNRTMSLDAVLQRKNNKGGGQSSISSSGGVRPSTF